MYANIKLKSLHVAKENRIDAIMELRVSTGLGLYEAKMVVDRLIDGVSDVEVVDVNFTCVNANPLHYFSVIDQMTTHVFALKNLIKDCIDSENYQLANDLLRVLNAN